MIGGFITSPADLVTLASISARAMSAAADLTRFPLVEEFRLVEVIAGGPVLPIPETTESTDVGFIRCYFYELGRAKFTAVRGGRRTNVELGQEVCQKAFAGRRKTSFEVQTRRLNSPGPVVITNNELYVLDLDDDDDDDDDD
jgi:hypothetical protein